LERLVREAESYVDVSSDLRPRVLEAARRVAEHHWAWCRVATLAMVAAVVCVALLAQPVALEPGRWRLRDRGDQYTRTMSWRLSDMTANTPHQ
jgi:hypothetical protein